MNIRLSSSPPSKRVPINVARYQITASSRRVFNGTRSRFPESLFPLSLAKKKLALGPLKSAANARRGRDERLGRSCSESKLTLFSRATKEVVRQLGPSSLLKFPAFVSSTRRQSGKSGAVNNTRYAIDVMPLLSVMLVIIAVIIVRGVIRRCL